MTSSRPAPAAGRLRRHRGHQHRPDQRGKDGGRQTDDPAEQGEAHALLVKAASDPDWHAACEALDALLGKLLVVQRLLEVDGRLAKRAPPADSG